MMTRTTSLTLAALVVATLATTAAPALAQDHGGKDGRRGPHQSQQDVRGAGPRDGGGFLAQRNLRGGGRNGNLLALTCREGGADRLEHVLLNIEQRTDPTTEQQPLFDTLKTTVLEAQTDFVAACEANRPARGERGAMNLAERLAAQFEIEKAQVAAKTDLIPAFDAFYTSLTDAQKATLEPRREGRRHLHEGRRGGPAQPGEAAPAPAPGQEG